MAEPFDCPRCGAPVKYDPAEQGNKDTISCPYCGETIIVPKEMHPQSSASQKGNQRDITMDPEIEELLREEAETAHHTSYPKAGEPYTAQIESIDKRKRLWNWIGWAGTVIGLVPVALMVVGVVIWLVSNSISSKASSVKATATTSAQNELISAQSKWPAVIQEEFRDNHLKWTTGIDNSADALVEKDISDGSYIWKVTSKQSIGSFTFPVHAIQKDVFISVDMQMTTTSQDLNDKAGIAFRHSQTKKTFYFFGVSPNGSFSLSMYDGDNWNHLIPATNSTLIQSDGVNHLAVSMVGDQIILLINDQIVGSYQDDHLASGDAGVGINLSDAGIHATTIFKHFVVRTPQE